MGDRALADLAFEPQPSSVSLDDMLDDREAEPGAAERAAAARIDPVEALGDSRDMLGGDAVALVAHAEMDHVAFAPQPDANRRSPPAVAKRVHHQIVDDLEDLGEVAGDRRKIGIGFEQ